MGGRPKWFPDWTGETVVIVASGPTAVKHDLYAAVGAAKFMVINNSWRLAPWADALFACDHAWWKNENGCPDFGGLKITSDHLASREYEEIKHVRCSRVTDILNVEADDEIGWGGNSGFGAINLAVKFKAKRIVLVGFDLRIDKGNHWHGSHPPHMHNPHNGNVYRWRRAIDAAAKVMEQQGIEVLNCSPVSKLENYPKVEFSSLFETV